MKNKRKPKLKENRVDKTNCEKRYSKYINILLKKMFHV